MQTFDDSRIFVNEDLTKPENRVNVALFGLMPQDWFRRWFLGELNLPVDSVVYPPMNVHEARPDLRVETPDGSATLAWIEIELGTNQDQIEDYRSRYKEPIKSVRGRRSDGGNLSLEEIYEFLGERIGSLSPQTRVNVGHLRKLIREGREGHARSVVRSAVSDAVQDHPLVVGLRERLAEKLVFTSGRVGPGRLRGDAIEKEGFSLWGFSSVHKDGTAFLLNLSDASQVMRFPSRLYLEGNWPHSGRAIDDYAALLNRMGLNIDNGKNNWRAGSLHADGVLEELDDLARCVLGIVEPR